MSTRRGSNCGACLRRPWSTSTHFAAPLRLYSKISFNQRIVDHTKHLLQESIHTFLYRTAVWTGCQDYFSGAITRMFQPPFRPYSAAIIKANLTVC